MSKKRNVALTVGAASIAAWAASKVIAKPIPREKKPIFTCDEPIILANRGGRLEAPENTMAAFEHAAALGVHGFVVNVRLTKDEQMIVFHDEFVNRTTNLSGKVTDFTLEELQKADAGYNFKRTEDDTDYPYRGQGLRILTLEEVLNTFNHLLVCIQIQESPESYEGSLLPSKLWHLIENMDAIDRVIVQSEHEEQIDRFKLYAQDQIAVGGGVKEVKKAYSAFTSQFGHFYRPSVDFFWTPQKLGIFPVGTMGFIRFLKKLNVPLFFQNITSTEAITLLCHAGATGFITDSPGKTMDALQTKIEQ